MDELVLGNKGYDKEEKRNQNKMKKPLDIPAIVWYSNQVVTRDDFEKHFSKVIEYSG